MTTETWPSVSVVMPVRDEAEHLEAAVAAVRAQEYPGRVEICLAVAPSTDGTERIAGALAARHDGVDGRRQPGRHDTGRAQRGDQVHDRRR